VWQSRAKFSVDHGSTNGEQSADGPQKQNEQRITQIPSHQAGRGKDSTADDIADKETTGCKPANVLCLGLKV